MIALPHVEQQHRERELCGRIGLVACLIILGFTGISARLYWLQVRKHDEYTKSAAKLRSAKLPLAAKRGSLWDCNGELLAQDRTVYELHANIIHLADPLHIRKPLADERDVSVNELVRELGDEGIVSAYRGHVVQSLAQRMGLAPAEVESKLQTKAFVKSKDNDPSKDKYVDVVEPSLLKELKKEEADAWKIFLKERHITGVYVRSDVKRFYPAGDRLAHVLGTVQKSKNGYDGVEQLLDAQLRGADGWERIEKDAKKEKVLPGFIGELRDPRHGCHAVLTIDMTLQHMLEEKLIAAYNLHRPRKIMGVITDPITGSILAMASIPLNQPLHDDKGNEIEGVERRNMAVTDSYEPGSTMKIVTIAGALEAGSVSFGEGIPCHCGQYEEPANKVKLKDDEANVPAYLSTKYVLVHSSNVGAYMIAKTLGSTRFRANAERFGLGHVSGLHLPRESSGILWPLETWTGPTLSRMAMGYEINVTPLQMAMVVGVIANKGRLMQPRLVSRIITPDGQNESVQPPIVVRQAISERVAKQMTEAMVGVVTEGTAKQAAIPGIAVAGKTGTAQRFDPTNKHDPYPPGHYVPSFVGFAPAEAPKVACVIVLDDPKTDGTVAYGGKIAAPIFADIVQSALAHLDAMPERSGNLGFVTKQ